LLLKYSEDPEAMNCSWCERRQLLTPNVDLSLLRVVRARDHIDQGGFTGAVFSKDYVNLALTEIEVHRFQSRHPREPLRDSADLKQR
jgi:hypothetical protein